MMILSGLNYIFCTLCMIQEHILILMLLTFSCANRAEEKCLVRSGLVHLLDKLCSLTSYRTESNNNTEAQNTRQRVASMAWAGFQVLSNRCVTWEQEDGEYG